MKIEISSEKQTWMRKIDLLTKTIERKDKEIKEK